jgi:hypothetical protein
MNFGHATLPSSGAVTGLVPAVATARSHEERFGVGVTGTTLMASRGRKIGTVACGPCILLSCHLNAAGVNWLLKTAARTQFWGRKGTGDR